MYRYENLAEMYHDMSHRIFEEGTKVCPRNQETYELIAPEIYLHSPIDNLAFLKERKYNLVYSVAESMLLVSKVNEVKYFTKFNPNMANFSDDGKILNGSYGYRIADNIDSIVERLKSDKDSRQAVLTIYQNDVTKITKDPPCTMNLHFLIRDNKLNLIVYMRSNDIIWGTPYDVFMFTTLQRLIANQIGVYVGWYRHIPSSFHVYSQHYDLLKAMKDCEAISTYFPFNVNDYRKMASDYINLVDNDEVRYTQILEPKGNAGNFEAKKILNLLFNQAAYKDPEFAAKNNYSITDDIPYWAKKFVTRWYK